MTAHILRRILISVPLLVIMSFIIFGIIRLPEGDVLAPYRNDPKFPPEEVKKLEHKYHFDRPFPVQYFHWVKNMFLEWPRTYDPLAEISRKARTLLPARDRLLFNIFSACDPRNVKKWLPTRVYLDLGYSFVHRRPVVNVIVGRLFNTLLLSVVSMITSPSSVTII